MMVMVMMTVFRVLINRLTHKVTTERMLTGWKVMRIVRPSLK